MFLQRIPPGSSTTYPQLPHRLIHRDLRRSYRNPPQPLLRLVRKRRTPFPPGPSQVFPALPQRLGDHIANVILKLAGLASPPPTAVGSAEQRPVVAQDHGRRVVAGGTSDAAAGMRAAAAMVKALEWAAIIGVAQHRARREQLVQAQRAVEDVAAEQAKLALKIEGREGLPPEHALREARRVGIDGCDHEVG